MAVPRFAFEEAAGRIRPLRADVLVVSRWPPWRRALSRRPTTDGRDALLIALV